MARRHLLSRILGANLAGIFSFSKKKVYAYLEVDICYLVILFVLEYILLTSKFPALDNKNKSNIRLTCILVPAHLIAVHSYHSCRLEQKVQ